MFDLKAMARAHAFLHRTILNKKKADAINLLLPHFDEIWKKAVSRLQTEMEKAALSVKDETLKLEIIAFAGSLQYTFYENDGHILITSHNLHMERSLHYGTTELPVIKPLEMLVRFIKENVMFDKVVFTARQHITVK